METNYEFIHSVAMWEDYTAITIVALDKNSSCRIQIYNDNPQEAIVSDLYVAHIERRKGVATKVLDYCIRLAKSFNCTSLSLRSDANDWVRAWYRRSGFEEVSSHVWLSKKI